MRRVPSGPGHSSEDFSLGVVNGSATRHFTFMSSSSYLLVLALAVTAVITAVVIYFAARHLHRVFLDKGQPKAR